MVSNWFTLLEKHVLGAYKEKGELWLKQLPELIDYFEKYWDLKNINPIMFPSYNYVAFCDQVDGTPAVLKISPNPDHISDEIKTHQYFSGKDTVTLLGFDQQKGAVLLERAVPGDVLKQMDRDDAIAIYADVIQNMQKHPKPITDKYVAIYDWFKTIDRIQSNLIDPSYIKKAKQLINKYYNNEPKFEVCHGDLHLENVIAHGDKYIAIDPKGVLGDLEFEASAFDLLTQTELTQDNAKQIMLSRIKVLAETLKCDQQKLQDWFFLRSLISAQWFIEDEGDPTTCLNCCRLLSKG